MSAKRIITSTVAVLTIVILVALNTGLRVPLAAAMGVDIALIGIVIPAYMLVAAGFMFGIALIGKGLALRSNA